jgi:integrase/recombinase XerD
MTPIRQRFIEELKLHGQSPNTIDVYVRAIRQLSDYYHKSPLQLTDEHIRTYLLALQEKGIAVQTYNVAAAAIKRFYQYCCPERPLPRIQQIPIPFKLPEVLSVEEVKRFLDCIVSLKYKTIFSLIYSSGLRAGECTGLRLGDIDSKRMLIHIRNAKGNKDRYAVIGNCAIELLREYFKAYRPKLWLFEGSPKERQLHVRSLQKVFKRAIADAGIKKAVRPHTLRHSFATHLLEQKCPLPAIQRFLGHKNIRSTLIYTHITPKTLADIVNPLDALMANNVGEVHHD